MSTRSKPTASLSPLVASLYLAGLPSNADLTRGLLASFASVSRSLGGSAVTAAALAGMTKPATAMAGQTAQSLAQHIGARSAASAASIAGNQIASLFPSPSPTASLTALTEKTSLGATNAIKASATSAINYERLFGVSDVSVRAMKVPALNLTYTAPAKPTAKLMMDLFEALQAEIRDDFAEQNVKIDDLRSDVIAMNTKMTAMAIDIAAMREATLARWILLALFSITALTGLAGVVLTLLVTLNII